MASLLQSVVLLFHVAVILRASLLFFVQNASDIAAALHCDLLGTLLHDMMGSE